MVNHLGEQVEFRIPFLSSGRVNWFDSGHSGGTYEYVSTGLNTGTLTVAASQDGGGLPFAPIAHTHDIIAQLTFTTTTTGTFTGSLDGSEGAGNFSIIDP